MNKNNNENDIKVKNIEQSIERMLKRASGEQDKTIKRDGNLKADQIFIIFFYFN
jgi:hypothetical protein